MKYNWSSSPIVLALICTWASLSSNVAAQSIPLGAAQGFAVLGGSTVTNTGPSIITGDLGVSPGTAITGFPPGTVTGGVIRSNDAVAMQAHADASTAFVQLGLEVANTNLTGQDLGGLTLTPGIYKFNSSAQLTGTLRLDTGGDPNAVFHFQIASTLTTASNSMVILLNGNSTNIFWQVGSSATLGTGTQFVGTVIADQSITLTTGAALDGRALAINGAVTLDSNRINSLPPSLRSVDLAVVKTVDVSNPNIADTIVYTVIVTNNGPDSASNVTVTDLLPAGLTLIGAVPTSGSYNAGSGLWTVGVLANAGSAKLTVTATVNVGAPTRIDNTACAANTPEADSNSANNCATASVIVRSVDLAVVKTVDISNPNIGDTIVYTVIVTNNGPDSASNVTVTDALPAGLTLIGAVPTSGSYNAGTGLWTVGALANAGSARLTITATVNANAPASIDNTACASNAPETDSNPANNCATASVAPSCARRPVILSGPTLVPTVAATGIAQTFSVILGDNGSSTPAVVSWNFGDGAFGSGASVQHTYAAAGVYTVVVSVANACGGAATTASTTVTVLDTPLPLECTVLHANFNLVRANSDRLTFLTQLTLPLGFHAAGQRVSVQINGWNFSAVLDAHSRYSDSRNSVYVQRLGSGMLLVVKVKNSAMRSSLLANWTLNANLILLTDMPFLVQIGGQTFAHSFDIKYVAKKSSELLTK